METTRPLITVMAIGVRISEPSPQPRAIGNRPRTVVAVVRAGEVRLRPILMATATTVLGLSPMALGLGDGAEIRTPMAIAVISGLIASTVLTLLIIPTLYALLDRLQTGLAGRAGKEESSDYEALPGTGSEAAAT